MEHLPQAQYNSQIDAALRRSIRRHCAAIRTAVPGIQNNRFSAPRRVMREYCGSWFFRCHRKHGNCSQQEYHQDRYVLAANQQNHHNTPFRDSL